MKSEGRGVPASVRHLDAVRMLRLALLRFSMHLWRQYLFEAVLGKRVLVHAAGVACLAFRLENGKNVTKIYLKRLAGMRCASVVSVGHK